MERYVSILFLMAIAVVPAHGQDMYSAGVPHPHGITSSGLGTTITTEGNTFDITGGTRKGANLFHSFGKFNLHSGESAVFHDAGIANTVGRVTGGDCSWINGALRSGAKNLYLLNPAGAMFGPGASLDLAGSFHVSTADYLRMGERERFYAVPRTDELLSVAAPSAFGFLDDIPGKISSEESFLQVSRGKNLSMTGGDISIHNSIVHAGGGEIRLTSVASPGLVRFRENGTDTEGITEFGEISVSRDIPVRIVDEGSFFGDIEVSGMEAAHESGAIFIRGGRFELRGGVLSSHTFSAHEGRNIDIRITDDILIDSAGVSFGGGITAGTSGSGKGGDIVMESQRLTVRNGGLIASSTSGKDEDAGTGGDIEIRASDITFTGGGWMNSATYGKGKGGTIRLKADGSVSFSGENGSNPSMIQIASGYAGEGSGQGGNLEIQGSDILFRDGAGINSLVVGTGDGGSIRLEADESVRFEGQGAANPSTIEMATFYKGEGGGEGGSLEIQAPNITFAKGAAISSATGGTGKGGSVSLKASNSVSFAGEGPTNPSMVELGSLHEGEGGSLEIEAPNITFSHGAWVNSATSGTGKGGSVSLKARDSVSFAGEGSQFPSMILMATQGEGDGGSLAIEADRISFANGAMVLGTTFGRGDARDISLTGKKEVRLTGRTKNGVASRVLADAYSESSGGNGGQVRIKTERLFLNDGAEISTATSASGDAGKVIVEAGMLEMENHALISSKSTSPDADAGETGTVIIAKTVRAEENDEGVASHVEPAEPADSVSLRNGSSVSTEAENAGGGRIHIHAKDSLRLSDGKITAEVAKGEEKGGDIVVGDTQAESGPRFVILNHSRITANADRGDGGAIFIHTDKYVPSSDSKVTASSNRGNEGSVRIEAPDTDIAKDMSIMPGKPLDAARWLKKPCTERTGEDLSRFVITGRDSVPLSFEAWLPDSAPDLNRPDTDDGKEKEEAR